MGGILNIQNICAAHSEPVFKVLTYCHGKIQIKDTSCSVYVFFLLEFYLVFIFCSYLLKSINNSLGVLQHVFASYVPTLY